MNYKDLSKETYKDFILVRNDDGNYCVYRNDWEFCGIYTTYSQALNACDMYYKFFGGAEC